MIGDSLPVSLASRLTARPAVGGQAVVRLRVHGTDADDTVVARMTRELSVDVALLSARIDEVAGRRIGWLTLGIPGSEADRAISYLSQNQFSGGASRICRVTLLA